MNLFLTLAALLAFLGGVIHSALGERLIFRSLDPVALPAVTGSRLFTHRVLRLFWHLVSVAWWGLALILWNLAGPAVLDARARWIGLVIAATFLTSSTVALVWSRAKHFAWVVLLAVGLLILLGLR